MRILLSAATAVVILAIALLVLMTPFWTHFALGASGGSHALTSPDQALALSDRTVTELFVGPGTFSDYAPNEAGHMRDVRLVLLLFLSLAAASIVYLAWKLGARPRDRVAWSAVARGGAGLAVTLVVLGVLAAVAFEAAFELFHRILFPGGNFEFPADSLLIRLYPYAFWQLSAAALVTLGAGGGVAVWWFARRRARSLA